MEIDKKVGTSVFTNSNKFVTSNKKPTSDFGSLLKEDSSEEEPKKENQSDFFKSNGNVYGGQSTDRGTKIIQPGQDMDKNAFLRILAAQMSNQDPSQPQDGTEYVSQFAQFAAMEQMSNLNSTMTQFASQSLIGKGVMLNSFDSNGNAITGIVRSVSQSGSKVSIGVEYLNAKGEKVLGEFENKDITNVIGIEDNTLDYINSNTTMLVGSGMIDKSIEYLSENGDKYETLKGIVKSVIVEDYTIKLKVKVDGEEELKTVSMDKVTKVNGKEYINKI